MDGATSRAAIEAGRLASPAATRPTGGTLLHTEASRRGRERKATVLLPYHHHAADPDAAAGMVIDRRQNSPPTGNVAGDGKNENIGRKLNHKE